MRLKIKKETYDGIMQIIGEQRDRAASASLSALRGKLDDILAELTFGVEKEQAPTRKTKLIEKEERDALDN